MLKYIPFLRRWALRNIDEILAGFHTLIDELDGAETKHAELAAKYRKKAVYLQIQEYQAEEEAKRAREVAAKLRKLVS